MSTQLSGIETKAADSKTKPVMFQSAERKTALLELFTSEGCSSCPPAEAWLSRLKDSPRLWKDVVPIAFHVDYWDYLGWRDRWGSKVFSKRQQTYAQFWQSDTVYTPGFVLNGKEWRTWSNHRDGPPLASSSAGVLKATSADLRDWQVDFFPLHPTQRRYEVHAVLLVTGLRSEVNAGENRGRHLIHDFVALEILQASLEQTGQGAKGRVRISRDPRSSQGRFALAVWVTAPGLLEPLQATGGWFPAN